MADFSAHRHNLLLAISFSVRETVAGDMPHQPISFRKTTVAKDSFQQ